MRNIGVFVCWCGLNISRTIDIKRVVEEASSHPQVICSTDYKYLCSEPGQKLIKEIVKEKGLEGYVIAACSPGMHETTFRELASRCEVNPYLCEMANIREQCSWVHEDREEATGKAIKLVNMAIEKVLHNEPLYPESFPLNKRAMVIGAGVAGMQAALDIADAGYEVLLVEKRPFIGGHMTQLSETFPTLDCAQCILTPKTAEVARHPRIKMMPYSEVEEVKGYVGNFEAVIRRKATFVDWNKCTGCAICIEKCPKKIYPEFECGLKEGKSIDMAFPQAVPYKVFINKESCIFLNQGKCGVCAKLCPEEAIDFQQQDQLVKEKIGAIIVATGYDLIDKSELAEFGYGKYKDVIDGMQFERINSSSGPFSGVIRRPSDGKIPKEIVFIQCAGSRDREKGKPYCSKICCMYTAKQARLYKHKVPDGQVYVFYMDIRAGGKGYEEFIYRSVEESGMLYLRGQVSRVFEEDGKLIVWGMDTLSGKKIEINADMVVLASAIVPSNGVKELANILKITTDEHGFIQEAHPKLKPIECMTRGVYLAGCGHAPKDIAESVAQGSATASKVFSLFSRNSVLAEPTVSIVNKDECSGCLSCETVCPYQAIEKENYRGKVIAKVNSALCQGCGSCTVACRSGAIDLRGYTNQQIMAELEALLWK